MADTSTQNDTTTKRKTASPVPTASAADRLPIGFIGVIGINTSIGKTEFARAIEAFMESASVEVQLLHIETGERRREFGASALFIDANRASEAAYLVGGPAALFDEVWPRMSAIITSGGVVVVDCGAGEQHLLLDAAAAASLDLVITELGASCCLMVVTTPEPECGRQAVQLVSSVRNTMSGASVVLAVNNVTAAQQMGMDTPSRRAFDRSIAGLKDISRIDIPFARGQALDCYRSTRILDVLRCTQDDVQLMRWSGRGQLASRAAQAALAGWYVAVSDQLRRLFWP
jgi:hypothetical protein